MVKEFNASLRNRGMRVNPNFRLQIKYAAQFRDRLREFRTRNQTWIHRPRCTELPRSVGPSKDSEGVV